jgi:hypothetical protein
MAGEVRHSSFFLFSSYFLAIFFCFVGACVGRVQSLRFLCPKIKDISSIGG